MRRLTMLLPVAAITAAVLFHTHSRADQREQQQQRARVVAGATAIQGVPWYADLAAAQAAARRAGKPVLLLQLFGRLDEKWC